MYDELFLFLRVAEFKSFTKAARELNISINAKSQNRNTRKTAKNKAIYANNNSF